MSAMRSLLIGCAALLACSAGERAGGRDARARGGVWIRDVTLVSPERGAPLRHAHVLIRGGRIAWVGKSVPPALPAGVREIDGTGRFLVPGLIDGHVHLAGIPGMTDQQVAAMPAVAQAYFRQLPRSYLYFGFTAVVDLNVSDRERVEAVRTAPVGPAVFHCGPALPLANGYPMSFAPPAVRFSLFPNFLHDPRRPGSIPAGVSPADHTPAAAVARVGAWGGICVKTFFERGFGRDRGKLPTPTVELIREVVSAGHARRLPVLLHANSLSAHRFAVDTRPDAVVHGLWNWEVEKVGTEMPAAVRQVLDDEVRAGIATMPTTRVIGGLADLFHPDFLADPKLRLVLPAELLAWYRSEAGAWFAREMARDFDGMPAERARKILRGAEDDARAAAAYFAARGGRLVFGSDTPSAPTYANPPGYNGYLELRSLESGGLSPGQILEAATRAAAALFGLSADLGTIEKGKRASLLLLGSDPLTSVAAFDTIELVIVNGRVIPRRELVAP
jgi:imidazolonepropionase-like amidohydrolase